DLILYTDSGSTGIRVRDLFWRGPVPRRPPQVRDWGRAPQRPDTPPTAPRPGLEGCHPPTEARV
ncbi:hypothetical protein, partial [Streptomyces lunaelactis]|uniref:hypothetical protein n=1 Tax=Streptomyces lunaelactis TaxID=1535768 RepID=UPI001C30C66C